MRLHHSANSPYVRKVMVVLHETGQADQVDLIPSSGSPVDPGTAPVAQNPLGKVPTLERPEGGALYDSRVICRYLDARGNGRLFPEGARLWDALTLEALADGMLDAALLMVYETRIRPETARHAPWVEGQWTKIARALDMAEARWLPYLAGPLCIGQIALGCALGYLDLRHTDRSWRDGHTGLADWHERIAARDSFTATVPPG
ncbi:MAG: glutathione S-transferase [Rhodobacteraceae bacterium]|nr:glutathione S-transferase [Paracoccaceae bacterium]